MFKAGCAPVENNRCHNCFMLMMFTRFHARCFAPVVYLLGKYIKLVKSFILAFDFITPQSAHGCVLE